MEATLGQIILVPYNFIPVGWAECNGQLLDINSNAPLYSLMGTTYGGDGVNTFALPDFRGRVPVHQTTGFTMGQMAGAETHTLTTAEMPAHTHTVAGTLKASTAAGNSTSPASAYFSNVVSVDDSGNPATLNYYNHNTPNTPMATNTIQGTTQNAGNTMPHSNMQPYLVMTYIISTEGTYPSRP